MTTTVVLAGGARYEVVAAYETVASAWAEGAVIQATTTTGERVAINTAAIAAVAETGAAEETTRRACGFTAVWEA